MTQHVALLHGAPLSGKGQVAQALASDLGFTVVSTSGLIKKHSPELWQEICSGAVVDDERMIPLLDRHMPSDELLVIDCLRSAKQIQWIHRRQADAHFYTIHLSVSTAEIFRRLSVAKDRGTRQDDKPEILEERLRLWDEYSREIEPMLVEFTEYKIIPADQPLPRVLGEAIRFFKGHGVAKTSLVS